MAVLFISHSSKDRDAAQKLVKWLSAEDWAPEQIFYSPKNIASGDEWKKHIEKELTACDVMLVLLSDNWVESHWCNHEFSFALARGKRIITILAKPVTLRIPDLVKEIQYSDISSPRAEAQGFDKLREALAATGFAPKTFRWPPENDPHRAVYRGLQALDVQDAAIFFGRDAEIGEGLEKLRILRSGATPNRMLVILGASGSGKSSFLRAGLLARLQKDRPNYIVLDPIRPETAAITGSHGFANSLANMTRQPPPTPLTADWVVSLFRRMRDHAVSRLKQAAEAAGQAYKERPPTIIIPIDQGEELFGVQNKEKAAFCTLLADVLDNDSNVIVIFTIRSDSFSALQRERAFDRAPRETFDLPEVTSFMEIIEGPAKVPNPPIQIERALSNQLVRDLSDSDALPLLAFTLERLQTHYGHEGRLTLSQYNEFGGLGGAIRGAVGDVIGDPPSADMLALARSLFVPNLVKVDDDGVKRLLAVRKNLPREAHHLIDAFVNQRLLVADENSIDGQRQRTIEVVHEAILRQWPDLVEWIEEGKEGLIDLNRLRAAAREWLQKNKSPNELSHFDERLARAVKILARPDHATLPDLKDLREYVEACRKLQGRRESEVREKDDLISQLRASNQEKDRRLAAEVRKRDQALQEYQDALKKNSAAGEERARTALAEAEARVTKALQAAQEEKNRELSAEIEKRNQAQKQFEDALRKNSAAAEDRARQVLAEAEERVKKAESAVGRLGRRREVSDRWDDDDDGYDYREERSLRLPTWETPSARTIALGVGGGLLAILLVLVITALTPWGRTQFPILASGYSWTREQARSTVAAVTGMLAPKVSEAGTIEGPARCTPTQFYAGRDGAKLRASAGRGAAELMRFAPGALIEVTGCTTQQGERTWYEVVLTDGRTGFVRDDVLSREAPTPAHTTPIQVAPFTPPHVLVAGQNGSNVRAEPRVGAAILVELDPETPLRITGRTTIARQTWYRVVLRDGRVGFVRADTTETPEDLSRQVSDTSITVEAFTPPRPLFAGVDGANVRARPQRNGALVVRLSAGTPLTITGRVNAPGHAWYRVQLSGGRIGFVRDDVTTPMASSGPPAQAVESTVSPRAVTWRRRPTAVQLYAAYFRTPAQPRTPAEMVMLCVVQSDGGLDDCRVTSPSSPSRLLEDAAPRVARLYRLEPRLRDGSNAVGRRIALHVAFDPEGSTSD
ncbi:SH3 domain-containing protein [Terricaulis sp.]|uniref:nSTAND1 domain-containing NTPase n=1 Tax=Terricaulis sp. TaxID=2768686 RepID=UPI0037849336